MKKEKKRECKIFTKIFLIFCVIFFVIIMGSGFVSAVCTGTCSINGGNCLSTFGGCCNCPVGTICTRVGLNIAICKENTCTPKTCLNIINGGRAYCGSYSNGCGGTINCGTCPTGQTCNTATGQCSGGTCTLTCGDSCNTASCSGTTCVTSPKPIGTICNDGNACTTGDTCQADSVFSTKRICKGTQKSCTTTDKCVGSTNCDKTTGTCTYNKKNCNDNNPCTDDRCDITTGNCINTKKPVTDHFLCEDSNACTSGEFCQGDGTCSGGTQKVCPADSDNNDCTNNLCDINFGCQSKTLPDGTSCTTSGLTTPLSFLSFLKIFKTGFAINGNVVAENTGICQGGKCVPDNQCKPAIEKEGQSCTLPGKKYAICKNGECKEMTCDNLYGAGKWTPCGDLKSLGTIKCCNSATETCCDKGTGFGILKKGKQVCCLKEPLEQCVKISDSMSSSASTCVPNKCGDQKLCPEPSQSPQPGSNSISRCCPKDSICLKTDLPYGYPLFWICGQPSCDLSKKETQCPPPGADTKKTPLPIPGTQGKNGIYCCKDGEECIQFPPDEKYYWLCRPKTCPNEKTFPCQGVLKVVINRKTEIKNVTLCCSKGLESCTQQPNGFPVCRRNANNVGNPSNTNSFSAYMVREKDPESFTLTGIAYIISPHVQFNKNITITLADYDTSLYETYKIASHEAVLNNCQKTLLSQTTKTINSASNFINLNNEIQVQIPAGALSSSVDLKIEKYNLENCPMIGQTENFQMYSGFLELSTTIGLYNPTTSNFYLKNNNSAGIADIQMLFGSPGAGWFPFSGDWDGDGIDTIGIYNPVKSIFYLRDSNDPRNINKTGFVYGVANSLWKPIAGDWNGDGIDTIGAYNPITSTFYLKNNNSAGTADLTFLYGSPGANWLPISGDWDGDGIDTIGLYNPTTSNFYLKNNNSAGIADIQMLFGSPRSGWSPFAGDWDGDGIDTIGIYNPIQSRFYLRNSNNPGDTNKTQFLYGAANSGWKPIAGTWI